MDYDLCNYECIKKLLESEGFSFSKSLGQNFIVDRSVCPNMVEHLGADSDTGVLEIGPGAGVLTKELCRFAGKVASVEVDEKLYPVLERTLADFDNFELVRGDIMKLDVQSIIDSALGEMSNIKVCANLPYCITSPVLIKLLEANADISEIEVMVQREVAERLTAQVGSRNAGPITVLLNLYGCAKKVTDVPSECFYPRPSVDSAVIKITMYQSEKYEIKDRKKFFSVVRGCFASRRKTLVNSLSASAGIDKKKITNALENIGLEKNIRAEKLTMQDFVNLYNALD